MYVNTNRAYYNINLHNSNLNLMLVILGIKCAKFSSYTIIY